MAQVVGKTFSSCLCRFRPQCASLLHKQVLACSVAQVRGRKRWHKPVFKTLYNRRIKQGPEPDRHRSEWHNWNYEAEVFAFGKRLGEDFLETTLKTAFTHRSYIEKEKATRADLGLEGEVLLNIEDNAELMHQGEKLTTDYVRAYLRNTYPALPEEGVCAINDYLLSDEMMASIGSNIGMKDLILCSELHPSVSVLSEAFKAVIGGLAQDQGVEQAQHFVQDFILVQLVGKELGELWEIINPMGLLQGIITKQGRGDVESRLLYETGTSTILSVYMVGVYSDKLLLGKGYGETVTIAEEMSARDALKRIFGLTESQAPHTHGEKGHNLQLDMNKLNPSVNDYLYPNQLQ